MRKRLFLFSAALLALSVSIAKPAAANSRFNCDDSCSNSTNCSGQGCIICMHAVDAIDDTANKCQ
jgi:hypothetical protein